ncbi:TRAP transporter small permease [Tropicimonas sp. IMCC34011]|uniref:TRAP transporter small permease n=1 Tax=Tropicimonas sp. IMCC34011 TaxID=2248759 RepID=UPI0018E4FA94|nr:TRAP transporter small permease [Tropicimonas sp. IMCC34011]
MASPDKSHVTGGSSPPVHSSLWDRIERGPLIGAATLLLLAATLIMLWEAGSRAFFSHSYFWAEEAVRFMIIWAFFLTLGAAGRGGYHIRTDLVTQMLSQRMRVVCGVLAALIGLAFAVILFWGAIPQIRRYYSMGMLSESNLELPMWAVFMAMPIGAVLYAVYYARLLLRALKGNDPFADDEDGPAGKF